MAYRIAAVLACSSLLAAAEAPPAGDGGALGVATGMGEDALGLVTAPLHWDGGDWGRLGLAAAAAGGAALLDVPVERLAQRHAHGGPKTLAGWCNPLGTYGSFVVLGGFGAEGLIAGDQRGVMVLRDGVIATVVASGLVTPGLKLAVGRSRPNQDQGAGDLHPFSGGASFPSGHVTQAFAAASVIATVYDDSTWVPAVAYALAGTVAAARIIDNKHWLSDTVAGAAIGSAVGWGAVKLDRRRRLTPVVAVGPDGWLAGATLDF